MSGALLSAPVGNLCAERANFPRERTVASNRIGAKPADRRALDAAGGAIVGAFLTDHMAEAVAAFGRAVVASGDALPNGLCEVMAHGFAPTGEWVISFHSAATRMQNFHPCIPAHF